MSISKPTFPLDEVTDAQLQALCHTLWDWTLCAGCSVAQPCVREECPQRRSPRLEPFFQYYKEVTASYVPELLLPDTTQAIRSHEDLFDIICLLKEKPTIQRAQLTKEYFSSRVEENEPPLSDQHRAFNLAMRAMAMVNCCIENQAGGLLESGEEPSVWRSDKSLHEFISSTFPMRDHPSLNEKDESAPDIKAGLTATKLKKVAGLKFKGTNDLRNHLKLDQKAGIVEIYHHTSVLKEHLMASKARSREPGSADPVLRENLPRQLALETLDSLQKVLFPLEPESQALLRSLVSKQSFDPDCLRFGSALFRRYHENDITYQYWGSRLMDLYEEIENPKPRGLLETWLEQRSKARHVMLATLVGVIIAIILGVFGLLVGIFQAWVSYHAWKYPVNSRKG
ncbi:hypothetical protein DL767_007300 [Monosporascus sp. MG133]|nr:hypothetical protein DL767_007300 [Monosporascus sp. MG133]